MGLLLVTPPERTPVTLEEVKAQLNIDFDDEDSVLEGLILAATEALDGPFGDLCGRALMPQTWDLYRDSFPTTEPLGIRIPLPPLISVDSVNYIDPDTEMETVLAASEYEIDLAGIPYGWVVPVSSGWPSPLETINAVRIRFTAGHPDTEDSPAETTVPAGIRQAIMLLVQDMYGQGSAFVDRTQTPNAETIERLTRHHVIRAI